MKASQIAFGRKGHGKDKSGSQAVYGKNMSGGPKGRKKDGQTSWPKGNKEPGAYGSAHSSESSFDDGYLGKLK